MNDRQPYSITIESERAVESFCIFFKAGLAEDVYRSLHSKPEKLLDNPSPVSPSKINFFDKTYPHDHILSPALLSLKSSFAERKNQPGWLEEQMRRTIRLLLEMHGKTRQEVLAIDAVRPSTREELYRRIFRAKDFIVASFDRIDFCQQIRGGGCSLRVCRFRLKGFRVDGF